MKAIFVTSILIIVVISTVIIKNFNSEEIQMSGEKKALAGIESSIGTESGEYGIDLFVSHHIEVLPITYWQKHLNVDEPTHKQVVDLLMLQSKWDGEEVYDFTLPGNVTDSVLSVSLDEDGNVENIAMES